MLTVPRPIRCVGSWHLFVQAAATAIAVGPPVPVLATTETDCAALGREALRVDLSAAARDTRHVVLRSGETLHFTFEAEPGPFGRLTLIEGAGSPRPLLVGPSGTTASFVAQRGDAFGFQFAKDGEAAARFTVTCAPSDRAPGGNAAAPALEPSTLALGEGAAADLQIGGPHIAPATGGAQRALPPIAAPAGSGATIAKPNSADGTQMKLQWLDRRYVSSGPEGPQIDPNASGVEIGVNYKFKPAVTIGALAQVNPAAEILLGAQRSLADRGWMAGPFTTLQLAPGLVLDARAAWGEGQSGPAEAAATAAQRSLVSARLANQLVFGAWRFTPSVNFNYLQETPPGAPPGAAIAGEAPAAHTTAAGRVDLGPELVYRTDLTSAAYIEPRAVVGGFWDFDSLAKAAGATGQAEMRLKAEAGVTIGVPDGPKLQASGVLVEGDNATPDTWGGRLQLSVPLK